VPRLKILLVAEPKRVRSRQHSATIVHNVEFAVHAIIMTTRANVEPNYSPIRCTGYGLLQSAAFWSLNIPDRRTIYSQYDLHLSRRIFAPQRKADCDVLAVKQNVHFRVFRKCEDGSPAARRLLGVRPAAIEFRDRRGDLLSNLGFARIPTRMGQAKLLLAAESAPCTCIK
jgi:hypothetical protein